MVLWEIRSYPAALRRERHRLLALTELQDTYGRLAWRWRAPRRVRALYRLGELAPADPTAVVAAPSCPWPRPAPILPAAPDRARTQDATSNHTRSTPGAAGTPRTGSRAGAVSTQAAEVHFAADLAHGRVPSARRIKAELHVGQDRAARIHDHLAAVAAATGRRNGRDLTGRIA